MRRGAGPEPDPARRQGQELSGARAVGRRLDLDGGARERRREQDPQPPLACGSEMVGDAGLYPREVELPIPRRQSTRPHPCQLRAQEDARRRSARGDDSDQDRAAAGRRPRRPLDDRFRSAAAVRKGGQLLRQRRSLAVRNLEAAVDGLSRRGLRQDGDRRARRRPQPGHLDLGEPSGHAGDGEYHPLPVRLRARLPYR